MLCKRRGLSNIVTAAILLSAVALMGTGLVSWSQSNLTERQANLNTSFQNNINKLKESVILEYVWFSSSPKFTNMTITNIGTNSLNIVDVEFRNPDTQQTLHEETISDGQLSPSESYSYQTSDNVFDHTPYSSFTAVITTERGSIISTQVTTP
ncbi:hypothetical protein NsoK4_04210 [Nitrosopumilus sp. K4]|uniref:hypothetical protein n=1 Tax=Nitrosopumilus sp. K4 TaxID=2795383 RepID=UPI001BA5F5AC|nr:hypothetical protein [Nitrosopumilus sp. K4]QUC65455.1 hypothetical protein NsoK4_04210 [Nitrosopumilus sp. K4]